MDKIKLAIIDVDGLFYHSATTTMESSIQKFQEKFQNILDKTQCTHYIGFYSNGRYFRHNIDPEYKGNRKKSIPPKYLRALKFWAIAEYGFQYMDKVEADDLCAYWMNQPIRFGPGYKESFPYKTVFEENFHLKGSLIDKNGEKMEKIVEKVLCSPDKDLLYSIKGRHFNYSYKLTDESKQAKKDDKEYRIKDDDTIKGWWIKTSDDKIEEFVKSQMIIGDAADHIKGIEGKGLKYWEGILNEYLPYWSEILDEYTIKYGLSQGIYNFQRNYRLLHLLDCDDDFIREIGKLPEFPIITEITKETIDIKVEF